MPLDQIYDQLAVRVIVNNKAECYHVLGIVHARWHADPERVRRLYRHAQGKHVPVAAYHDPDPGRPAVRDPDPHLGDARGGRARHRRALALQRRLARSPGRAVVRRQAAVAAQPDRLAARAGRRPAISSRPLKTEVLEEQVYVFTPKGKIIDLPLGSTPVDFAYRIHSEVGNNCIGARVNNRQVPLDYQLENGDVVAITTAKQPRGPSRDWLEFVKTANARNHIRRWFRRQERGLNIAAGRDMLERELKRLGHIAGVRRDRRDERPAQRRGNVRFDRHRRSQRARAGAQGHCQHQNGANRSRPAVQAAGCRAAGAGDDHVGHSGARHQRPAHAPGHAAATRWRAIRSSAL